MHVMCFCEPIILILKPVSVDLFLKNMKYKVVDGSVKLQHGYNMDTNALVICLFLGFV